MNKTIFILLSCLIIGSVGCEKSPTQTVPQIVNINGCQYFKLDAYGFLYTLCHVGNCTNHPIVLPEK